MRKSKRLISFILLLLFISSFINLASIKVAFADTVVDLQMTLAKVITGTAPFNTTGAGEGLHPGDDYSSSDNYVRTLDIITYDLHYSVNPAGGVGKNTTITSTIPLNADGKVVAVWEDKLMTMYPGLTISDDGRTLTYNMGDKTSGNAYTFSPTAKVLTTAANGETFTVSASIRADNATVKTTQPYTATVSALPKVDLSKQTNDGFEALGPNGEKGKVYTFGIGLAVGDAKGGEAIPGTITFTDDLSAFGLPNARLYTFDGKPAVGVNGDGRDVVELPNGRTTDSPEENCVAGSPIISATQASPGANINISIANIDQMGRYFPTKNSNDTPIPADKKYIFAGYIALWVNDSDITLGNTTVTNKYTGLSLTGASGNQNYGGQSEPLGNNTVSLNVFKSNTGRFMGTYLSYTKSPSEYAELPTQTSLNSGDGVVYPGQTFGVYTQGGNGGEGPLNNYETIVKIDTTKLQVTDLPGNPGVAYVLSGSSGLADIFQVQYGTGTYGSFNAQQNDTAQGATWYNSTTEALASGTGPINKVRLIAKPGQSVPAGTRIDFGVNVTALNNPIGTVIPSVMAVRADEVDGGKWNISKYDPINHNLDQGDRVFITEVLARIQKSTEPAGVQTAEVNKEVTFKLTPTLTTDSRYTNVTTVENVTITDTLAKGLTYVYGSSSLEPSSVVKNQDGTTTIKWTLANVNINESIAPITLKTIVDFDVKNATVLENKVVISTPSDSSSETLRTSKYGVNIVNLSAWGIGKFTPDPTVELGDDLTYTLRYAVFKEEVFSDFNFIDILPYNGDIRTPVTSFNGTYTIKELSGTNGETFYFTTDPQSDIKKDPLLNTNTWIPYTPEAAVGKNITAIKIHANTLTSTNGAKDITVKLAPVSNNTGDIYVNDFSGRVSNVDAMVHSNDVPISVVSSSVGDYVWNDKNFNKVQDTGEEGLTDVTVNLYDASGNLVKTTVTDSNANYIFNDLHSGNYTVKVDKSTLAAGMQQTYELDNTLDGSVNVSLAIGQDKDDVDFGFAKPATVGDTVWNDANGNGAQDAGESGIPNVKIKLVDGSGNIVETTTDSNGKYKFENVVPEDYTILIDESTLPAGVKKTYELDNTLDNSVIVSLISGQVKEDVDFGFVKPATVGDTVWNDINGNGVQDAGEVGMPNVKVKIVDGSGNIVTATTDSNGKYKFENVVPGNYTVSVDETTLPAGMQKTYELDNTLDNNVSISLIAGQIKEDVDFGFVKPATIGDTVWSDENGNGAQDAGEVGIPNVKVKIVDGSGNVVTATTDSNGKYKFENVVPGNYTVSVDETTLPAGMQKTYEIDNILDNNVSVSLTEGQIKEDVDFGFREPATVGDTVWNDINGNGIQEAGEAGIPNVKVKLVDGSGNIVTVTTDSNGKYKFENVVLGNYTVSVDETTLPAGMQKTYELDNTLDNNVSLSLVAGQAKDDVDFGFAKPATVGDTVWNDANGNGVQEASEAGIPNVKVKLVDGSGNTLETTTDSNGKYKFENVVPGNYTVVVDGSTVPSGMKKTYELDNTLNNSVNIGLTAGEVKENVDFGYAQRVGDLVVKYLEKGTDKELSAPEDDTNPVGTDY
ncbi:carboxypeptidase regulatory-like domain-containing protein, partial [Clostridium gasigenes]|uniref:SdrD B-like domain-containing protein n=1 Tax=Clostridium gasigenes TaxID=94869 RepID=UPI001C0DD786